MISTHKSLIHISKRYRKNTLAWAKKSIGLGPKRQKGKKVGMTGKTPAWLMDVCT